MKIIFLGTNGWYTTPTGNTPCILIDSKEGYIIFDAGNGFYKIGDYITEDKPIHLFISHFHLDHTSGLHIFNKFNFSQGIDVYVGAGRKKDFEELVRPPYTLGYSPRPENVKNLKTEIRLHELADGKHEIPFPVEMIEQFHGYRDHGFRVTLEGKTISYSGDCGISEASLALAKEADLLIHECSFIEAPKEDKWGHVIPSQAAKLAKDANAKKLILTHFAANIYDSLEKRKEAEKIAKKIFPETISATDDLIITL